jgi:GWxTD domain-containing protein
MRHSIHSIGTAAFFSIFILAHSGALAQVENIEKRSLDVPEFSLDAMSFYADTLGGRVDVYVQMPYDRLHFLKIGNAYGAKYEVTMSFLSADNTPVVEKSWMEDVEVSTFEASVAKGTYDLSERSFYLQPAKYKLRARVNDPESDKASQIERTIEVPKFSDRDLSLSDIMIVNKLTEQGGKKTIVPNVSDNVGQLPQGFYLFFEIYSHTNLDSVDLRYSVVNPKGTVLVTYTRSEPLISKRSQVFFKFDSLNIPVGGYKFVVEARKTVSAQGVTGEEQPILASVEKTFTLRWAGMPRSLVNLDAAIDQMQYIAKGGELEDIKSAPTLEEKRKRFLAFWRKRDPTPGTDENELMEEYYNRVEYANKHFAHYIDGWKTDMGMVYIILGSPNSVDRHPFEYDSKPYEIWYYYERNRRFVFLDDTGFGDYRLITPIGDIWQRY